jgi:hypothetical protein
MMWTNNQVAELRERFPDMNSAELAESLGRTLKSVELKAWKLKLRKNGTHRNALTESWSTTETDFLIEHYPLSVNKWISERLGRTEEAIRVRAKIQGLRKDQ